ncbi:MAG: DUF4399 domain-containing protein [Cyclobacteriaceae bacterium]
MKNVLFVLIASGILLFSCSGKKSAESTSAEKEVPEAKPEMAKEEASVFFKHPEDGATVPSPVFIEMGVKGMQIEPAGKVNEGFGHHHILINQDNWPVGQVIPASDSTIHFGKGQTDASLELEPGNYKISLQFADGVHTSYGPDMSATINITVE